MAKNRLEILNILFIASRNLTG